MQMTGIATGDMGTVHVLGPLTDNVTSPVRVVDPLYLTPQLEPTVLAGF